MIDFGKEVKPTLNRVFVKMILEKDTYFGEVKKLDSARVSEPYVEICSIGDSVKSLKVGDLGYLRPDLNPRCFNFNGDFYGLIYEHDIEAVISPAVAAYMKNEKISKKIKETLS